MKTYKVKVNGKLFEVQLEEVTESTETISAPVSQPAPTKAVASNGSNAVEAPIAGKILSVKVNVGDTVKKGQVVAVVEAMKLENEIPSTIEGTVKEICVKVGDMVSNKDAIVILG
ncbi:MAG: biotin/lipoyl-binding protein [Clostridiales bacterium]|nr:biotin/lipoyl-binding protein [Clostridiales bacterium]